jgi:ribosomal-protein-alanine N-acetyltransferase
MIAPPHLTTERLSLEPLSRRHSHGMFLLWSRKEVCRYSGPAFDWAGDPIRLPAETTADSDKIIDFFEQMALADKGFRWAVIARNSHEFAGAVGFNNLALSAELAFHLRPEFWGRGLMREATQAALEWVSSDHPSSSVEAFIQPGNTSSINLARRLGFQADGTMSGEAARFVLRT